MKLLSDLFFLKRCTQSFTLLDLTKGSRDRPELTLRNQDREGTLPMPAEPVTAEQPKDHASHPAPGKPPMTTATATGFTGTFHGRADEVGRVRRELAAYLSDCPVAADSVLIASELAANAVLHSRSRGESFRVRCELSAESVRVEVEDMGGPWHTRPTADDRPHGLDVVTALGAEWGTVTTVDRTRVVWARLAMSQ